MEIDDLYGVPLDRFVAERGALARALRADGRRDEAAGVASLRKPSVAAWAVNQLVRTQRRAVSALYAAGDALGDAQSAVLAGRRDGRDLRAAVQRERAAVDALVEIARGLLSSEGHELSAAVLDRVADTLQAAALDDDSRAQVAGGRLERELRHVGLGVGALSTPAPPKRAGRAAGGTRAAAKPDAERETIAKQRADAKAAKAAAAERAQARRATRIAEADARREADRAARALRVAQERHERAAQALREADEALSNAASEAELAAEAHRRAREALDAP